MARVIEIPEWQMRCSNCGALFAYVWKDLQEDRHLPDWHYVPCPHCWMLQRHRPEP